jgi:DNA-binding phage protein
MSAVATNEDFVNLLAIAMKMQGAGLPPALIAQAVRAADLNEGVRELMVLWDEAEADERDAICADIQEVLDDLEDVPLRRVPPQKRPRVAFDDLDDVLVQIKAHKQRLRDLIDKHGGVSDVARKTGIPQPSLSRMLNSGSMPRRSTLYKIANALGLPEKDVVGDWVR